MRKFSEIKPSLSCPLCTSHATYFWTHREKDYYQCPVCDGRFMDGHQTLDLAAEKARYETHNNDIDDPRYQKFVSPVVNAITAAQPLASLGLDFGSGTGPVITDMLQKLGYTLNIYDPLFAPDTYALSQMYHYIVTCEVVEHFYHPQAEFQRLYDRLINGGTLYLKTELFKEGQDFSTWHYINDPTHVFLYTASTFEWIKTRFGFQSVKILAHHIELHK